MRSERTTLVDYPPHGMRGRTKSHGIAVRSWPARRAGRDCRTGAFAHKPVYAQSFLGELKRWMSPISPAMLDPGCKARMGAAIDNPL